MACGRRDIPAGFSLIELTLVVVILAVIGSVAMARMGRAATGARAAAFVTELRTIVPLLEEHRVRDGAWPGDSNTGEPPPELVGSVPHQMFGRPTPIGGSWDIERNDSGVGFAVGVHFKSSPSDDAAAAAVDRIIDDGDTDTGLFRRLGPGRYYLILEP